MNEARPIGVFSLRALCMACTRASEGAWRENTLFLCMSKSPQYFVRGASTEEVMNKIMVGTMIAVGLLSAWAEKSDMAEDTAILQAKVHELEKEIKRLSAQMKTEKYGLRWVECPEAFEAESENKIPILAEVPEKAIKNNDGKPTHILIEGDNYHALTCLNFTHRGKIDVIYIDPPYNTGSDGFTYKDKRYLDKYPDGEKIDKNHPLRHSAWLSFMSKRLRLAKDLLSDRGVIFISIDDNEMANLKLLCDDPKMFGEKNFIGNIAWESKTKSQNTVTAFDKLQPKVEHILVYAKGGRNHFNLHVIGKHEYSCEDEHGEYRIYRIETMAASGVRARSSMVFKIKGVKPPRGQQWKLGKETIQNYDARGDLILVDGWPCIKIRPDDERSEITEPFWGFIAKDIGTAESAKKELTSIVGEHNFETVKPVALIRKLLFHATQKNSYVLDFFAGSGTTMEAVLKLNKVDDGSRKCILCTDNENDICAAITYPRLNSVISGYESKKSSSEEIYREQLTFASIKNSNSLLERVQQVIQDAGCSRTEISIENNSIIVKQKNAKGEDVAGLGGSLKYYKTEFVGKHRSEEALDEDRAELAAKAGSLLAMAEETLEEKPLPKKQAQYWQWFTNDSHKHTLIYFSDDLCGFKSLVEITDKIRAEDKAAQVIVYVFAIGSVEGFENEFDDMRHITLKPIPEPILAIYKAINGD